MVKSLSSFYRDIPVKPPYLEIFLSLGTSIPSDLRNLKKLHSCVSRSVEDVKQFFKPLTLQFGRKWWMVSMKLKIPPESYLIISVIKFLFFHFILFLFVIFICDALNFDQCLIKYVIRLFVNAE